VSEAIGTRVLVTGGAGFIGMHVALRLARDGADVVAVDNFDPYYDVALKEARVRELARERRVEFRRHDLCDREATAALFRDGGFARVVHLAAQPGVRYSLVNPGAYLANNVDAFGHVLEGCRHAHVAHLVYASSSSVYGANHTLPFSEDQRTDTPVSLYAATKKADEMMAYSYAHLYALAATGLRFFTVYGPWGRPDMATMIFTRAILEGRPIEVFNHGDMRRDFTYVDDIVEGVARVLAKPPAKDAATGAPHAIYNIGNNRSVPLGEFIATLERLLGRRAKRVDKPMQSGDVKDTYASIDRLAALTGFAPKTPLADGLAAFVDWYRGYYGVDATAPARS
jgi:UDP-glucuronate 4-epimerase